MTFTEISVSIVYGALLSSMILLTFTILYMFFALITIIIPSFIKKFLTSKKGSPSIEKKDQSKSEKELAPPETFISIGEKVTAAFAVCSCFAVAFCFFVPTEIFEKLFVFPAEFVLVGAAILCILNCVAAIIFRHKRKKEDVDESRTYWILSNINCFLEQKLDKKDCKNNLQFISLVLSKTPPEKLEDCFSFMDNSKKVDPLVGKALIKNILDAFMNSSKNGVPNKNQLLPYGINMIDSLYSLVSESGADVSVSKEE